MRGLLFSRPLFIESYVLPWRNNNNKFSSSGMGRGKKQFNAKDIFSTPPKQKKNNRNLSDVVSAWKRKSNDNDDSTVSNNNSFKEETLGKEDLSKILGEVLNKRPESIEDLGPVMNDNENDMNLEEDVSLHENTASDGSETDNASLYETKFPYTDDPKYFDMPHSEREIEKALNSKEGLFKLGKLLGTPRPPKVRFVVNDIVPKPLLPNVVDISNKETQEIPKELNESLNNISDESEDENPAEDLYDNLLYTGTSIENTQQEILSRLSEDFTLNKESTEDDNKFIESVDQLLLGNYKVIHDFQYNRGYQVGKLIDNVTMNPGKLYDIHKTELKPKFEHLIQEKCKNDSEFAQKHEIFLNEWNELLFKRDMSEEENGPDHEKTLLLDGQLDRLARKHLKYFSLSEYNKLNIDLYDIPDYIPRHEDYKGEDGDEKLVKDFNNQSVKLLSYDEYLNQLPKMEGVFLDGVAHGYVNHKNIDDVLFHATRYGSYHYRIHEKVFEDALYNIDLRKYEGSLTLPLPTNLGDLFASSVVIAQYNQHTSDFREHLENFLVTRLSSEISAMKEDNEDFEELATRFDQLREKSRKRMAKKAFVLERSKQRAIDNGTFVPKKVSIITKALNTKGIVEEQDILDQALVILRSEGKKYTHEDIPSIRKDNFNQKFRAIYFNGNLTPHDKSKMVALTISNFIVTPEELKVAEGALEIMSSKPTPYEQEEKELQEQASNTLTFDLNSTTYSVDNKTTAKAKITAKKEDGISYEGYNTSDFEVSESEFEKIPEEFKALEKFKPHNKQYKRWASAVDEKLELTVSKASKAKKIGEKETEVETDEWVVSSDSE